MAMEQKKRPGKPAEAIVKNWNVVEMKVDGDLESICTVINRHLKHDCHLKQTGPMVEVCLDHTKQI